MDISKTLWREEELSNGNWTRIQKEMNAHAEEAGSKQQKEEEKGKKTKGVLKLLGRMSDCWFRPPQYHIRYLNQRRWCKSHTESPNLLTVLNSSYRHFFFSGST